ncbi:MAG: nucleotidyltransferase domain-containing protein [Victivallaceae bacterium]|nr:nucleotidyltransferase domain-containing protein [Victivallaceae bacterium]
MDPRFSFRFLSGPRCEHVIFHARWGSFAFGTATPESDCDSLGVFVLEKWRYLSMLEDVTQVSDARGDNRFYPLRNYLELAAKGNPNVLDSLFLPEDCILKSSRYWQTISGRRDLFVSREAGKSYGEYALAQIRKARGRNKLVRHPQPETAPTPETFCRFLPAAGNGMPGRPHTLAENGVDLREYRAAAVEYSGELFRLYHYGPGEKGVFRNGNLVCGNIPYDDEKTRFRGFLLFNKNAFEQAKSEHRRYWEWRRSRNERRWQSQETGELDYDAKNLMHTFRLLYSGLNIARCGRPLVRFSGEKLAELLAVRAGKFPYETLIGKVETLTETLFDALKSSDLPETSDREQIDHLLLSVSTQWEKDHAR